MMSGQYTGRKPYGPSTTASDFCRITSIGKRSQMSLPLLQFLGQQVLFESPYLLVTLNVKSWSLTDTITYFTMIMAVIRSGCTVFPISPRNSPPAVAHLIKSVGARYVLVGNEISMTDLANESLQALKNNYGTQVVHPQLISVPCFEDLYRDTGDNFETLPSVQKEPNHIIAYLHSSGMY